MPFVDLGAENKSVNKQIISYLHGLTPGQRGRHMNLFC